MGLRSGAIPVDRHQPELVEGTSMLNSIRICIAILPLLISGPACNSIRPGDGIGPVVDSSRIVAVASFTRGNFTLPVTLLARHFYYGTQPAVWQVVSSGTNTPVTRFEAVAVFACTPAQVPNGGIVPGMELTRVFTLPDFHTDGVTAPRIHIAPRRQFPTSPNQLSEPNVLVYIEGGPIYGGLRIEGTLDPQVTAESTPRLLVDAQVWRADLASDGQSIIYIDTANRVFSLPAGQTEPRLVTDLTERFGHVVVRGIRWHPQLFNTVNILLNRGGNTDELWTTSSVSASLTMGNIVTDALPDVYDPAAIAEWEDNTREVTFNEWKVPPPESFEE